MASSFISFNNVGFWTGDFWAELAAHYISKYIELSPNKFNWLTEMKDHLNHVSQGEFHGFISFRLDEYLIDDQRIKLFCQYVEAAIIELSKIEQISVQELCSIIHDRDIRHPLETFRVIYWLKFLLKLLEEGKGYSADDEINYDIWSLDKQ